MHFSIPTILLLATTALALPATTNLKTAPSNLMARQGYTCEAGAKICGAQHEQWTCCSTSDHCYRAAPGSSVWQCTNPNNQPGGWEHGGGGDGTFEEPKCNFKKRVVKRVAGKKFDQWMCA